MVTKKELKNAVESSKFADEMFQHMYDKAIIKRKAIDIILPLVKFEDISELLAELHDLREENSRLKKKAQDGIN